MLHLTVFRHVVWAELDCSLEMLVSFHWIQSAQADSLRPGCLTLYSYVRPGEFHLDCERQEMLIQTWSRSVFCHDNLVLVHLQWLHDSIWGPVNIYLPHSQSQTISSPKKGSFGRQREGGSLKRKHHFHSVHQKTYREKCSVMIKEAISWDLVIWSDYFSRDPL